MTDDSSKEKLEEMDSLEFLETIEEVLITSYLVNGAENNDDFGEDVEPAVLLSKFTIKRLNQEIKREIYDIKQEFDERVEELESEVPGATLTDEHLKSDVARELGDEIFSYFTLAAAILEHHSTELIQKELISEKFRDTSNTNHLLERTFNQETRAELLLRTGILENGTYSEIERVRQIRNDMVHDLSNRFFLESTESLISDLDRAESVVDDMSSKLIGDDGVSIDIGSGIDLNGDFL